MSKPEVVDLLHSMRRYGMLTRDENSHVTMLLERAEPLKKPSLGPGPYAVHNAFVTAAGYIIQCAFQRECKAAMT